MCFFVGACVILGGPGTSGELDLSGHFVFVCFCCDPDPKNRSTSSLSLTDASRSNPMLNPKNDSQSIESDVELHDAKLGVNQFSALTRPSILSALGQSPEAI